MSISKLYCKFDSNNNSETKQRSKKTLPNK